MDWVAPKAVQAEGGAQREPEKKRKKEKVEFTTIVLKSRNEQRVTCVPQTEAKLKPKLNFAVQTVQGSYYGSQQGREEVRWWWWWCRGATTGASRAGRR